MARMQASAGWGTQCKAYTDGLWGSELSSLLYLHATMGCACTDFLNKFSITILNEGVCQSIFNRPRLQRGQRMWYHMLITMKRWLEVVLSLLFRSKAKLCDTLTTMFCWSQGASLRAFFLASCAFSAASRRVKACFWFSSALIISSCLLAGFLCRFSPPLLPVQSGGLSTDQLLMCWFWLCRTVWRMEILAVQDCLTYGELQRSDLVMNLWANV